ncbi:hypothetical protein [Pseudomonas sp. EL_65y_Pfl1_R32]|uniref:hypothetical protein n=1 Tax=Pseudomonas sp. EL_65y_Pfl1_R32 TaxID=3088696 RepID=UPI0030DA2CC1
MKSTVDTIKSASERQYVSPIEDQKLLAKNRVDEILFNDDFVEAIKVVKKGMENNQWLRAAYISFYRGKTTVSLSEVSRLDWVNTEIFRLVCNLRNIKGWKDQSLFELESFAEKIS